MAADFEIFGGTLGLGAPIPFGGHIYITYTVFLFSEFHHLRFERRKTKAKNQLVEAFYYLQFVIGAQLLTLRGIELVNDADHFFGIVGNRH